MLNLVSTFHPQMFQMFLMFWLVLMLHSLNAVILHPSSMFHQSYLIFCDPCVVVSYIQFIVSVLYSGFVTSIQWLLTVLAHKTQAPICEGNYFFLFCSVCPNICCIITAVFLLPYIQKCVSLHMHLAESTKQQSGLQITLDLWLLNMECASCHPSGTQNLDVAPRFSEHLLTPGVHKRHLTYFCLICLLPQSACPPHVTPSPCKLEVVLNRSDAWSVMCMHTVVLQPQPKHIVRGQVVGENLGNSP